MALPQNKANTAISNMNTFVAILETKIDNLGTDVKDIKQKLDSNYATKEWVDAQYGQTKKIVNGLLATVASAVLVALLALVIKK